MTAPTTTITAAELRQRLDGGQSPRIIDVRTPSEFETAHIEGSFNVPLDVLRAQRAEVVARLDSDVVLVCRSGQRATQADEALRGAGLTSGRVLEGGLSGWESDGFEVDCGVQRWELERQVRLVAGSLVVTSVLGSAAVPKLKWLGALVGGGLVFAAVSNTCAMASALARLPYNRGAVRDPATFLRRLDATP